MTRFFEIIPGGLTWLTFVLMIVGAWKFPFATSVVFILYSLYWLLRLFYLHFHLRSSYAKMLEVTGINWLDRLKTLLPERASQKISWTNIYHLVIIPVYREPYAVLLETFEKLSRANYPKENILIVIGEEARGGEQLKETVLRIEEKYKNVFGGFLVSIHPEGISGEIPGKGSNESWAAEEARIKLLDARNISYENVVASVFDADTQIEPEYFGRLSYVFLTSSRPQRSSFQPTPVFLNNIFEAPLFSRVMAFFPTFWQMTQQSRPEQLITFTSQAMPFKAIYEIGFWDKNLVSEDSLIFWKLYLHYDGDWRTEPLQYPVSMDATVAPTMWESFFHLYKQQRRWAWGAENIPYMLRGFIRNKKIGFSKKLFWLFIFLEGFWSWTTAPFILFFLGWLPLWVGGYDFNTSVLSYNLFKVTWPILNLSIIGIAASAILSTALLPPKPSWFRMRHYLIYILQWALVPIIIVFFSAIPAIEAQTRLMLGGRFRLGFWPTPKSRKTN